MDTITELLDRIAALETRVLRLEAYRTAGNTRELADELKAYGFQ